MIGTIGVDCSHTSHCRANTGVQRVARRVYSALPRSGEVVALVSDPYAACWRRAESSELAVLVPPSVAIPGGKRGAYWSWRSRVKGLLRRYRILSDGGTLNVDCAILPEVFGDHRAAGGVERLRRHVTGPILAVFHDLIPLQMPEATPPGTVAAFQAYLLELKKTDVIAAVSEASAEALRRHWKSEPETSLPEIVVVPLASDSPPPMPPANPGDMPSILCVGSLEGRKNHVALLDAAESLWREGLAFRLEIVGLAHAVTGAAAVRRIRELESAGRAVSWRGSISDESLERAYADCRFTVYPSLLEGFGLPVIESLSRGKPCVCSGLNAMRESVAGGGCLAVGEPDAEALAGGIRRLLTDPSLESRLAAEAKSRPRRGWDDYARDILAVLEARRAR